MWIKITDRLPEPNKDVLVITCSGRIEVMYLAPEREGYCWGWYPGGLPITNSTHWMELPDKPLCHKT
jgi:hypothetical protein